MPKFDFFCKECGLLFDKIVQDSQVSEAECKSCKSMSPRQFKPHTVGITYQAGMPPTATIDQIVGSDAEKKWEKINSLHQTANSIRRETNSHLVELTDSGSLKAASNETKQSRKEVADIVINNQ